QAGVLVHLAPTFEGVAQQVPPIWTELLVTSGGWQPDLGLWLMAGGQCRWQAGTARLEAAGALDGVALAGSAAGYRNSSACAQSGEAAVAQLLGHPVSGIEDREIDPLYESTDAINAVAAEHAEGLAYLDGGESLTLHRAVTKPGHTLPFLVSRKPSGGTLADQPRVLSISDLASAVQVGIIPAAEASAVARERCLVAVDIVAIGRHYGAPAAPAPAETSAIPAYLSGRFGDKPERWVVAAEQARAFEPGCLVYINTETSDPLAAIGVVIGATSEPAARTLVLLGRAQATAGGRLFIRDISGTAPVKLVERFKPGLPVAIAEPAEVPLPAIAEDKPLAVPPVADQPAGIAHKAATESAPG
ncbi:MAG TPA: hypothetical protein VGO70_06475, partial [Arsenicitalea sp.]|nr:hypothetical protein [Arsenicitalea sp.]